MALERMRGVELGYGYLKSDRFKMLGRNHNAHLTSRTLPTLAGPVDMPATVHKHVRQQNKVAREIHKQPFAARFDALYRSASDGCLIVDTREQCICGFK